MNILFLDIDSLRPDHMGCYGYGRNTTPNLDTIAAEGVRFTDYYCSDAPCLPSRAALMTGQFGIHNGVVGHGGTAADRRLDGPERAMQDRNGRYNLPALLHNQGFYTASCSSFAARHGAWWFNAGFREMYNGGRNGGETADMMTPWALEWLDRNVGKPGREQWFLHLHLWDPHMPARTPADVVNPFEIEPLSDDWMTPEQLEYQRKHCVGAHSPMEVMGYDDAGKPRGRQVTHIADMDDFKRDIDGYDLGIWYADRHIGMVFDKLKELGVYEQTAVIVTSDHGEHLGELGIYNEHGDADYCTTHIPLLIKWPGMPQGKVIDGFHYNVDLFPTLLELVGGYRPPMLPRVCGKGPEPLFDGSSFAEDIRAGENKTGREYLVLSQCAHVCQRSVRFGDYLYIRTYHDGFHLFPPEELYQVNRDPHETQNLAREYPELCWRGAHYLEHWVSEQMVKGAKQYGGSTDPLWTVIAEGGPFHSKGYLEEYCARLEATGRGWAAEVLKSHHQ